MTEQELYKRAHEFFNLVDGKLIWKIDRKRCKIGMRAGCVNPGNFYRQVYIDNKKYLEHRIIFLMHYGYLPPMVDHINQVVGDNRIENLRASDKYTNQQNSGPKQSISGLKGARFDKSRNRYLSDIRVFKKRIHLGTYKTAEEAHEAYKVAALKYHGEFARF